MKTKTKKIEDVQEVKDLDIVEQLCKKTGLSFFSKKLEQNEVKLVSPLYALYLSYNNEDKQVIPYCTIQQLYDLVAGFMLLCSPVFATLTEINNKKAE